MKALPQAKKKCFQRFVKTESISAAKEHKREARVSHTADQGPAWIDLTPELLEAIFDRLDPCSLGVAACVCKDWHNDTRKESRWMRIYEQIWGVPMRQETTASWRESFKELVRDLMKGIDLPL